MPGRLRSGSFVNSAYWEGLRDIATREHVYVMDLVNALIAIFIESDDKFKERIVATAREMRATRILRGEPAKHFSVSIIDPNSWKNLKAEAARYGATINSIFDALLKELAEDEMFRKKVITTARELRTKLNAQRAQAKSKLS